MGNSWLSMVGDLVHLPAKAMVWDKHEALWLDTPTSGVIIDAANEGGVVTVFINGKKMFTHQKYIYPFWR